MSKESLIAVAVTGVAGKMGRAVLQALQPESQSSFKLAAALHRKGSHCIGVDSGVLIGTAPSNVLVSEVWPQSNVGVLIDFSLPEPCIAYLAECVKKQVPMVIGTTGFDAVQRAALEQAAQQIPIVLAPNMSVGVNLCFYLLEQITQVMGDDSDIEISETHHKHKLDAPSGTAVRMGEVIAATLGKDLADVAVYGREGISKPRTETEIGFSSLRAGDVVGDHTVLFANDGERLELTHKASSRQTFAKGALRAASWVVDRPAGLYDMQDVLGLR